MQGSISFLGHGAPVLDLPSRKGASDPTSGLKLCELPEDAILNARSRERGLHVVVYVEGTTRGSSQPFYCRWCKKKTTSSLRRSFAALACGKAPRPDGVSADVFAASQSVAKAEKTERSQAGAPQRTKMEGAKVKWQEQLVMLNSSPAALERHRLLDSTQHGDRLVCQVCGFSRSFDKRKEVLEAKCGTLSARALPGQASSVSVRAGTALCGKQGRASSASVSTRPVRVVKRPAAGHVRPRPDGFALHKHEAVVRPPLACYTLQKVSHPTSSDLSLLFGG